MGKGTELWDDSALVNAFDDAMSKYKTMHRKGYVDHSIEGGKATSITRENASVNVDEHHDAKGDVEADENSNFISNSTTEMVETNNSSSIKQNHGSDSSAPDLHIDSLNGVNTQDELKDYSVSQNVEDYTQLYNQYYKLEEKKQQILQQLQQYGNWNYQSPGGVSQEHQVPTNQASNPTVVCSCCPYICPYMAAPCTSSPACSCIGKSFPDASTMGPGKSFHPEDGDIVKTATGAAEKAISSMKMKTSDQGRDEQCEGNVAEESGCETDLTVVLNAWYSAGFYTGKYLTEQSASKKRHG